MTYYQIILTTADWSGNSIFLLFKQYWFTNTTISCMEKIQKDASLPYSQIHFPGEWVQDCSLKFETAHLITELLKGRPQHSGERKTSFGSVFCSSISLSYSWNLRAIPLTHILFDRNGSEIVLKKKHLKEKIKEVAISPGWGREAGTIGRLVFFPANIIVDGGFQLGKHRKPRETDGSCWPSNITPVQKHWGGPSWLGRL